MLTSGFRRTVSATLAVLLLSGQLFASLPQPCGCVEHPTADAQRSCCIDNHEDSATASCCSSKEHGGSCDSACGQRSANCECGCSSNLGEEQIPNKEADRGPRLDEPVVSASMQSIAKLVTSQQRNPRLIGESVAWLPEPVSAQTLFCIWRI